MARYGAIRTLRSLSFTAANCASLSWARAAVSSGLSLAWMKFIATNMPNNEPIGLNDCARLSRRVAVSSLPIDRMYGFDDVSRNDNPHVRMK